MNADVNDELRKMFGHIRAEEDLKDRTRTFLAERTQGYTGMKRGVRRYPLYVAACACLLLLLFGGYQLYFTPIAQISIDVNPSIELSVNWFDRVVSVTGRNEDGRALSHALDVKNKPYTDAIEQILENETITALLTDGEIVAITVTGSDERQSARMLSAVEACTAGHRNAHCYSALPEETDAAHEMGMSCGKYKAFLELQRLDPNVTPEAVQGMTMREIQDLIDRLTPEGGNVPATDNGLGNGHHGHHGHREGH